MLSKRFEKTFILIPSLCRWKGKEPNSILGFN